MDLVTTCLDSPTSSWLNYLPEAEHKTVLPSQLNSLKGLIVPFTAQ